MILLCETDGSIYATKSTPRRGQAMALLDRRVRIDVYGLRSSCIYAGASLLDSLYINQNILKSISALRGDNADWQGQVPDSKVHGANMGPTWVLSAPDGPHVGPLNLAIRGVMWSYLRYQVMTRAALSWPLSGWAMSSLGIPNIIL